MPKRDHILVGLDIGTTKICAIVAEVTDDSVVNIVGVGSSPSRGLRKGVVVNIESTVESIKKAVEEAELMAAVQINSFMEDEAATWDPVQGRLTVNFSRLEASIAKLLNRILVIQATGDVAGTKELLGRYGVSSPVIEGVLGRLEGVPIDLRPIYPVAGEEE